MRFSSFANLFRHRRVKSDGALGVLPSVSIATPATRPASDSCINAMTHTNVLQSDVFSTFIPAAPLSLPAMLSATTGNTGPRHSTSSTRDVTSGDSSNNIVSFLMERVRLLEAELRTERAANRELAVLKIAMKTEREARKTAESQIKQLKQELSDSQADVIHARSELYASLNRQIPSNDIHLSVLASENSALVAEKLRYRKFIELMVSAGGHKPVLDRAYRKVAESQDPEAAFVMAIREAMARPGNIWRGLLEPVRGPRAPEEYLAQVTCTIRARQDARDWKKKAKFWKMTALEDARHLATITPSVSAISSIIEELSADRKEAVDKLLVRLRNEGRLRGIKTVVDDNPKHAKLSGTPSVVTVSELGKDDRFAELVPLPSIMDSILLSPSIAGLASLSSSLIISPSQSSSTSRAVVSGNLPPLASQIFRETHSIKSKRNSHRLQLSISISGSLGLVSDLNAKPKRHSIAITPSVSKASNAEKPRAKHSRRRVEIVSAGQSDRNSTSASSSGMSSVLDDNVGSVSSASSETDESSRSSSSDTQMPHATNRADLSTSSKADEASVSFSRMTSPDTSLSSTVVETQEDKDAAKAKDSDRSSDTSRTTPEPKDKYLTASGKTSPSRLPVLKKIRRLSISRPTLVDTTNAGTFTLTSNRRSGFTLSGVWAKNDALKEKEKIGTSDKEDNGKENLSRPGSLARGQRTTRLDFFGTARRAMQSTRRMMS